jgi:hypothetical protein
MACIAMKNVWQYYRRSNQKESDTYTFDVSAAILRMRLAVDQM